MGDGKENLTRPPLLAMWLVQLCSERGVRDALLGDLHEAFHGKAEGNARAARAWYWGQAIGSIAPLLRRRANSSALAASLIVVVLTAFAFAGVTAWQEFVARSAAREFASAFSGVPIYAARLVYVAVQMAAVTAAAVAIALVTFDRECGVFQNALRRLSPLGLLVIAPPFVESFVSANGYPLAFVVPWAGAMTVALVLGARFGARLVA